MSRQIDAAIETAWLARLHSGHTSQCNSSRNQREGWYIGHAQGHAVRLPIVYGNKQPYSFVAKSKLFMRTLKGWHYS